MICIYGILNKLNGKYYIGSTINFSKRKSRHIRLLEQNKHHSYLLQKDWSKNNEMFSFIILEKLESKDVLLEREQWWIDNTNSFYNISKIAGNTLGVKRTEKTKEKLRKINLGLKHPEWRNKLKSASQSGENHWTRKKKFSEESKKKMSDSHKEKYKKGYINPRKGKKMDKSNIEIMRLRLQIPIIQYDLNNNFIKEWASAKEVQNKLGYSASNILRCCKNKRKTSNKFKWKYKNKKGTISQ